MPLSARRSGLEPHPSFRLYRREASSYGHASRGRESGGMEGGEAASRGTGCGAGRRRARQLGGSRFGGREGQRLRPPDALALKCPTTSDIPTDARGPTPHVSPKAGRREGLYAEGDDTTGATGPGQPGPEDRDRPPIECYLDEEAGDRGNDAALPEES